MTTHTYLKQIDRYDRMIHNKQLEIEDLKCFLEQEKQCSNQLRKERTKLKSKLTKSKNSVTPQQAVAVALGIVNQAQEENVSVNEIVDRMILEDGENNG